MTNKNIVELDAEFIEYKAEAKATMDALEKKIDDGIGKLDARIKAMKEESDAKFEELRQLILGTAPSQSTHVDHVPQITKVVKWSEWCFLKVVVLSYCDEWVMILQDICVEEDSMRKIVMMRKMREMDILNICKYEELENGKHGVGDVG
ncbi:hypothetical protein Tco_0110752 [Tanacetum coccineum]